MLREEQVSFCRICLHRKVDFQKGLQCGLTNELADFDVVCRDFDEDTTEKQRVFKRDMSSAGESPARKSLNPRANKIIGAIVFLIGIVILILSFIYKSELKHFFVPTTMLTYGAFSYLRGVEQVKILRKQRILVNKIQNRRFL